MRPKKRPRNTHAKAEVDASTFRETRSQREGRKRIFATLQICWFLPTDINKIIEEYAVLPDFKFEYFQEKWSLCQPRKRLLIVPSNLLIGPDFHVKFLNYLEWHFQAEINTSREKQIRGYQEATKFYPLKQIWENGRLRANCLVHFLSCCFSREGVCYARAPAGYLPEFCFLFMVSGIMCRNILGKCWAEYTASVFKQVSHSPCGSQSEGRFTFIRSFAFEVLEKRGLAKFVAHVDAAGDYHLQGKLEKWADMFLFPTFNREIFY